MADKIDIENLIFYQASLSHVPIHAREGVLFVKDAPLCLQCMVRLYNWFFEKENKKFLSTDRRVTQQEQDIFYQEYVEQSKEFPLRKLASLPKKTPH